MTDIALIPFPPGRTQNRPWARHRTCTTCQDDGLVVVGAEDETGPCPDCEAGFMVEFGFGRRAVAVGKSFRHVLYQGRSPWGVGGFWSRRPELGALVERRSLVPPARPVDVVARVRALAGAAPPDLLSTLWEEEA